MGILDFLHGNPKAQETKLEKKESKELNEEQSIFLSIIKECSEAHTLLKDAVSSFNDKIIDKWKLANLVQLNIKMANLEDELNKIPKENIKIIAITDRLAAKFPDDKAFEKKVRHFKTKLNEKTRNMTDTFSDFFKNHNLSDVATWIRKGESPKKYYSIFEQCSTTLKTISAEAVALQESLIKLYTLEKKYLSR